MSDPRVEAGARAFYDDDHTGDDEWDDAPESVRDWYRIAAAVVLRLWLRGGSLLAAAALLGGALALRRMCGESGETKRAV